MQTFKQHFNKVMKEMTAPNHSPYFKPSARGGHRFDQNSYRIAAKNLIRQADRTVRNMNKQSPEQIKSQIAELAYEIGKLYDDAGDQPVTVKGELADTMTKINQLRKKMNINSESSLEDTMQFAMGLKQIISG